MNKVLRMPTALEFWGGGIRLGINFAVIGTILYLVGFPGAHVLPLVPAGILTALLASFFWWRARRKKSNPTT